MRPRITFALLLLCTALPAAAQRPLRSDGSGILLEMLHPRFDEDEHMSVASGAYFLSGQFAVNPRTRIIVELPFAFVRRTDLEATETRIGNPYVGASFGAGTWRYEVGGRIPLVNINEPSDWFTTLYAMLADPLRMDAFIADYPRLRGGVTGVRTRGPLALDVNFGPSLWFAIGDAEGQETELFADIAAGVAYELGKARTGARLTTRTLLTQSDMSADKRIMRQGHLYADYAFGPIRPGLQYRFLLHEDGPTGMSAGIRHGSLGLSLQYRLPPR